MEKTFEERFKELFFDQIEYTETTYFYNSTKSYYTVDYYNYEGEYIGEYNKKFNNFWLSYQNMITVLGSEFNLRYLEIKELIKGILEKHFNLENISNNKLDRY